MSEVFIGCDFGVEPSWSSVVWTRDGKVFRVELRKYVPLIRYGRRKRAWRMEGLRIRKATGKAWRPEAKLSF